MLRNGSGEVRIFFKGWTALGAIMGQELTCHRCLGCALHEALFQALLESISTLCISMSE